MIKRADTVGLNFNFSMHLVYSIQNILTFVEIWEKTLPTERIPAFGL